ncbi:MAG: endolytic transglycosylase MltG [Heyndrickxia sp.]
MDRRTTRAFASGLLLSSLLLMGYEHFYGNTESNSVKKGYKSVKISDLNRLQKDVDTWKSKYQQLEKEKATSVKTKENPKQILDKYHLSITSGMTPDKIGTRLKTGGIIKDSKKFVQYLIDHNYHSKIQVGEYELNNTMSFAEIAKTITKGK